MNWKKGLATDSFKEHPIAIFTKGSFELVKKKNSKYKGVRKRMGQIKSYIPTFQLSEPLQDASVKVVELKITASRLVTTLSIFERIFIFSQWQ